MAIVLLALGCSSLTRPDPPGFSEPAATPPAAAVLDDAPPADTGVAPGVPLLVVTTDDLLEDEVRADGRLAVVPGIARDGTKGTPTLTTRIAIEPRGQSSATFPKRSYNVELRDGLRQDRALPLLGMPPEADWVLHGPYADKTALRNAFTYALARRMGQWAPRGRFTELRIGGRYAGLYVLFEKPELDSDRVDLPEPTDADPAAGGYLFKLEGGTDGGPGWVSARGVVYELHDPGAGQITLGQRSMLVDAVDAFEAGIADGDHPGDWIDVASFVDFVILQELSRNVDGYRRSTYLQRLPDTGGGIIRAGPAWDFDIAWGNADFCDGWNTEGLVWEAESVCGAWDQIPDWWITLLEDPRFQDPLRCRWQELRMGVLADEALGGLVNTLARPLREARARDDARWGTIGQYVWPNAYVGATWEEELAWMRDWTVERAAWLDDNLPGLCPG